MEMQNISQYSIKTYETHCLNMPNGSSIATLILSPWYDVIAPECLLPSFHKYSN